MEVFYRMEKIGGSLLSAMILGAAAAVDNRKQEINELNVFPVPDGDTGTNMSLTLLAASGELQRQAPATAGEAADVAARAMVRGARGNSGVILSLLFRGFGKGLAGKTEIDGAEFADAMTEGVRSAYKAVMKPAEGTILTVSRVAADSAKSFAIENHDPEAVIETMLASAKVALAETVHQNPVLEKAGVVDAGGEGFCTILDAMLRTLRGEVIQREGGAEDAAQARAAADFSEFSTEDITFGYCTEFIVMLPREEIGKDHGKFRAYLDSLGDSLVFVEDEDIIKIHVHTNDPGLAIQAGLKLGSLTKLKIENMREQHTEKVIITGRTPITPGARTIAAPEKRYGFVSVCAGAGLRAVFEDIGVDSVVEGGQTMNPSTEDILRAVDATPAEVVFVLPNNKNIIMAAEQCVSMSEKTVIVLPTKTVPQGVSAMLVFDPDIEPAKNREAMLSAASKVRTGQVTYAARDSFFDEKKIKQGDHLAILDGQLISNNKSLAASLKKLAKELGKRPAEFVTLFYGEDITEETAGEARKIFAAEFKNAEVSVVPGGQPVYYYLISVE